MSYERGIVSSWRAVMLNLFQHLISSYSFLSQPGKERTKRKLTAAYKLSENELCYAKQNKLVSQRLTQTAFVLCATLAHFLFDNL